MSKYFSTFEELSETVSQYLRYFGRSKQAISIHKQIWQRIKVFMDARNFKSFRSEIIASYLIETYDN